MAAAEGSTQQPIKVAQLNRELLCFSDGEDASINGGSSTVYLATYEGFPVAIKQFKPGTCIQRIAREADFIIAMGPHECLPLLLGIAVEKEPYLLILKFYGSYQNQLSTNLSTALILPNLPSNLWVPFIIKLAKGVTHLHAKNHIHGNLNKDHIMVYKRKGILHPKLVGLGNCLHTNEPEARDQELIALGHIISRIFNKLTNRHPSLSYFLGRVTDPLNGNRPKASEIAERFESLLEHFT
jgi:serine/threonine protein kinase